MSRPVGIALVGTGFALHTQLPVFRLVPGAKVLALVGREAEKTRELANQHGIPFGTASLEDVLRRDDIDLVCVTTPPDLHRSMSEAALGAGKHVLCEKPMAIDVGEAESMCRAARGTGRLAVIDHELRFAPNLRKMRRLLREGYAGRPLHVQVRILAGLRLDPARPFDWWCETARGGGALGALGSHVVDWVRWTFGEVDSTCGTLHTCIDARTPPGELRQRSVSADDYATFWLRLVAAPAPRVAVLLSVVAHRGGGVRFEIHGSEGVLLYDEEGRLWGSRRDPSARHALEQPPLEELTEDEGVPASELRSIPDTPWARAFLYFARALVPAVSETPAALEEAAQFEDGLAVQRVLDAVRRSASQGGWEACGPLPAPGASRGEAGVPHSPGTAP